MSSHFRRSSLRRSLAAAIALIASSTCVARDLYIADPAANAIYSVNMSATNTAPTLVSASGTTTLGSGIAFECILDIAIAPNGELFVMDGYGPAPRVIKVDLATGNRTLALALTGIGVFPQLHIRANGQFLISRSVSPPDPGAGGIFTHIEEYAAQPDGTPVLLTDNAIELAGGPTDSALVGERLRVMFPQLSGPWMITEAILSPVVVVSPDLKLAENLGTDITRYTPVGANAGFETTFSDLDVSYPQNLLATFRHTYGGSISNIETARIIAPDGIQRTGDFGIEFAEDDVQRIALHAAQIREVMPSQIPGGWQLQMEAQYGFSGFGAPGTELSATIWRMPSKHAMQLAHTDDIGVLDVLEAYPPALASFDSATAALRDRVPVFPPGGTTITSAMLNRASDFVIDGAYAYVALSETPRVIRVDRATGASVPLTSSRPSTLTIPSGGFHPRSLLSIAVPPPPASNATSNWSMY